MFGIFLHFTYNGETEWISLVVAGMIIGGVVVVDTSEISPYPDSSLRIFVESENGWVAQTMRYIILMNMILPYLCWRVVFIQSIKCAEPQIS